MCTYSSAAWTASEILPSPRGFPGNFSFIKRSSSLSYPSSWHRFMLHPHVRHLCRDIGDGGGSRSALLKSVGTGVDQDVSEALLSLRLNRFWWNLCRVREVGPQIMLRAIIPKCSMYGIVTYICHKNQVNVGEYTSPMDPRGSVPILTRENHFKNVLMWQHCVSIADDSELKRIWHST